MFGHGKSTFVKYPQKVSSKPPPNIKLLKIPSDSVQRFGFEVNEFSELEHTVELLPWCNFNTGTVFKIRHTRQSKILSVRSTKNHCNMLQIVWKLAFGYRKIQEFI